MNTVKVLGIAPYENMATLMRQVSSQRDDIEFTAYVGDLEAGAQIARQHEDDGFEVILSRGGTAELIREQSTLPVVDVSLSVYDILRSLKIAENYNSRYAIIGFPAITQNAHFLCEVMRYQIDVYTIHNEAEARKTLEELSRNGYNLVLCDMITNSLARTYGLTSLLITSGSESIGAAFDQAVQTSRTSRQLTSKINFYRTVLESQQKQIFVYSRAGELVYRSKPEQFISSLLDKMTSALELVVAQGEKKMYLEISGKLYILRGLHRFIDGQSYIIYYVNRRNTPISIDKQGITYANKEEVQDQFFNSFYGMTQASAASMTPEQYAQSSAPIVILGEAGTGKDQMANLLYTNSLLCNAPLVTLDFAKLHGPGWKFLTGNDNSPLTDSDTTIHFKNLRALDDAQFLELIMLIKDMRTEQRNRLIFTCTYNAQDGMTPRCRQLCDSFGCMTLHLPGLQTHSKDIASVASLYLSILNMQNAKELVGFEPEALALMEQFDWPGNYDQFRRVVGELATVTTTPYILPQTVQQLLEREALLYRPRKSVTGTAIDLSRTLDEINLDILRQVLLEEGGNQTTSAKRLGVSRTTLWRMVQKLEATQ